MGQNMVGWVRVKASGKPGDKVMLRHAEVLDDQGEFYTANLRLAEQTDSYILFGGCEEVFEPHFTFHGFRYVEIKHYPGSPRLEDFTGMVLNTDLELSGSFRCADERINQLQRNIMWSQKGNFVDIPTDCPQRNERLGWTGDAQVFIRTACFNMMAAPFFTKWLHDLKADQMACGAVPFLIPDVIPRDWRFMSREPNQQTSAGWGDAAVICPWTLYLCYGDERILEEQYPSMRSWVEYIWEQSPASIWRTGSQLGDWLALDAHKGSFLGATPNEYVATAYFAYSTSILAKTAAVRGRKTDAVKYGSLFLRITDAFRKEFIASDGTPVKRTQTACVLALEFGLLEPWQQAATAKTLADLIRANNGHLTTGFLGTPYLCHALSLHGYWELAYTLLFQRDYPSWLYQVDIGATTIWEHWDGIKEDGSFWSEEMNSFNHYAYGSIGDWLYKVAAGIDTSSESPGYKHIIIQLKPDIRLLQVDAAYESMYGLIRSAWRYDGEFSVLQVTVPANTVATVCLPYASQEVEEHFKGDTLQCINPPYIALPGSRSLFIGSGTYLFRYKKSSYL